MEWLNKLTKLMFTVFASLILIGALRSGNLSTQALPAMVALLLIVTGLLVLIILLFPVFQQTAIGLATRAAKFFVSHIKGFTIGFVLTITVYQIVLIGLIRADPGFDAGLMQRIMYHYFIYGEDIHSYYLSLFPNNQFYYILMFHVSKIAGLPRLGVWCIFNMVCIDVSIVLISFAAYRQYGTHAAYAALYIGGMLLGLSPVVLIPYTDTVVLPIVSTGLLALSFLNNNQTTMKRVSLGAVIGISAVASYMMKPSAAIPFIATLLVFCASNMQALIKRVAWRAPAAESAISKGSVKQENCFDERNGIVIKNAGVLLMAFVISFSCAKFAFSTYMDNQSIIEYNREIRIPMTHFIMMGLSPKGGGYVQSDYDATRAIDNFDDKVEYNLIEARARLQNYGLAGYCRFLFLKFTMNSADGSFFFRGEGGCPWFADQELTNPIAIVLGKLYFCDGEYFSVFRFHSQLVWIVTIALMLASYRSNDTYTAVLRLSVLGGLLFLLIFEGGRSRYLIQFLPMIILLASLGFIPAFNLLGRTLFKKKLPVAVGGDGSV